ncbi:hypothetical protein NDU88_003988 [Pleurodeles waltl]|uniref:Uncharacterized protein n=1 Tax=Pleurodeles waltl TaxID=8319 RepID=A0AAV7PEQ1_PLEWA|nr:hypothetical protein NDU88_003988 [Pleurodeles waltl]
MPSSARRRAADRGLQRWGRTVSPPTIARIGAVDRCCAEDGGRTGDAPSPSNTGGARTTPLRPAARSEAAASSSWGPDSGGVLIQRRTSL